MSAPVILNSKGQPIILNAQEKMIADYRQKEIKNAFGFEIDITTMTTLIKRVTEQKFFEIPFADYVPVKTGEGAWSSNLLTFKSYAVGGDFETGVINTSASNGKIAEVDSAVEGVSIKTIPWAKMVGWTIPELAMASKAGNWDLVTSKQKARKKDWDLGIQRIAFLGMKGDAECLGLLTQSDVTSDTVTITKYINTMTPAELDSFVASVYESYRNNCNHTARPTHFIIPEKDYNGLANFPDSTYPLKNRLTILQDAFRVLSQNPNFKILPVAYADKAINNSIMALNKNRYTLLNYDEDSVRMDIPVDYTATLANSVNNFQFQNVGYGQFTGVKAYRPAEMLYFDF